MIFVKQLGMGIVKYDDAMLILGPYNIFYAPIAVNFSMWFLQMTACIFEMPVVASHVIQQGSSLTESGAAIKCSDFSRHPGTRML